MSEKYSEEWVMSRRNPNHGLEPLKRVLHRLGDPQEKLQIIHVTGTNGKGSVCNDLKEILRAEGYRTGLFTSPHLMTHRDRIRINDEIIGADVFHSYLMQFADQIEIENLGMFEIDCVIAFLWFRDQKVDYAIMEAGLGGRLDNTNVISHSVLSVVTSVAYDHMQILGHRLMQIGFEKAGIMKPYGRLVSSRLKREVESVFRYQAARRHCAYSVCPAWYDHGLRTFMFEGEEYHLSSYAQYQKKNAALALYCAEMLGINIHTERVHKALMKAQWPGRFEVVNEKPLVILDGAHNEEGMKALLESMKILPRPVRIVYSALKDKPARSMAEAYCSFADQMFVTHFDNSRADDLKDLAVPGSLVRTDWKEALKEACSGEEGSVVVTGSLYFVSLVREFLKK